MKDIDPLHELNRLVHGAEPYKDRLRSTNVNEFTVDVMLTHKYKEFIRDTTLDNKTLVDVERVELSQHSV